MTRLFLHFWNVSATVKNLVERTRISNTCRPISNWQLNYIWSALDQVPLLHSNYIAHYGPYRVVASGGAVVPGPPFKIGAPPFHVWPPVATYIQYCILKFHFT